MTIHRIYRGRRTPIRDERLADFATFCGNQTARILERLRLQAGISENVRHPYGQAFLPPYEFEMVSRGNRS